MLKTVDIPPARYTQMTTEPALPWRTFTAAIRQLLRARQARR